MGGRHTPEYKLVYQQKWRAKTDERPYYSEYRKRNRDVVLTAYGGGCACCGETEPKFLCIDHINNNGAAHRHELSIASSNDLYRWLIKSCFPPGFQVLCANCNMAKTKGGCPYRAEDAKVRG